MWIYSQISGALWREGDKHPTAHGYAGAGSDKNKPASQDKPMKGPLPQGLYTIETPHPHPKLGPYVMNLTPDPANNMYGRSLFRIHGDSVKAPGTASEGCIILNRSTRQQIWESGDHLLRVVERYTLPEIE